VYTAFTSAKKHASTKKPKKKKRGRKKRKDIDMPAASKGEEKSGVYGKGD